MDFEELKERLSTDYNDIFYEADDGETYCIGKFEMQTNWFNNNESESIISGYLLRKLYSDISLYPNDSGQESVYDMGRRDLTKDLVVFLEEYFVATDADCNIFNVYENIELELSELPDEVQDQLSEFDSESIEEGIRVCGILDDEYDYHRKEAMQSFAVDLAEQVHSMIARCYERDIHSYPLESCEIDYAAIGSVKLLRELRRNSYYYDNHRAMFSNINEDLLLNNLDEFADNEFEEWCNVDSLQALAANKILAHSREFFLDNPRSDYGPYSSMLVRFAIDELKSDKEFAKDWLRESRNMESLQFFADEVRSDLDVLYVAIQHNESSIFRDTSSVFKHVSTSDLSNEFIEAEKKESNLEASTFVARKLANKLDAELKEKPLTMAAQLLKDCSKDVRPTKKTNTGRLKL